MRIFVLCLIAVFVSVVPALAKTVYLKNGEVIDCQRVWRGGSSVHVLVNRDTLLEFTPSEVDTKKTFGRQAVKRPKPKATKTEPKRVLAKVASPASTLPPPAATKKRQPNLDQSPQAVRLIAQFKAAYATGSAEELSRLVYWEGADDATRKSVTSTLEHLASSAISNVYVTRGTGDIPLEYKRNLVTYRPNLKLIGYLKAELAEDKDDSKNVKTTSIGFPVGIKDGAYRLCTAAPVK
jgi:hypothetical protein